MSELSFFQDLAVLMTVAGVVAVAFTKRKWPKVLGYIAAGVVLGKFTFGGSAIADETSVQTIGQLGVVFLMFSMGLDFSTSQMKRIKSVAMPVAIVDTLVMTWLGYTVGRLVFKWDFTPSLFLGVAICDSATTMLAKVIDEMKWSHRPFVSFTLGSSVCEDIICVGLIALVTGVANGKGLALMPMMLSLGGLVLFFLASLIFGLIGVPKLLKSVSNTRDDEALILTILGVCFGLSWVAFKFDFSLAIGAFLVGILGASSDVRKRLMTMVMPLKSMFAAVFFVSIGLQMNPMACFDHIGAILLLSAVVVVGKFLNCAITAILTGESVTTSVQIGMSLAQIGEFAFMVALLYVTTTGDAENPMFDIVVAVSVLTTLLSPFMIRWAKPVGDWMESRLPKRSRKGLQTYRGFVEKFHASGRGVKEHRIIKSCFIKLIVMAALDVAVAIVFIVLAGRNWSGLSGVFDAHKRFVFCLAMNLVCLMIFVPVYMTAKQLGKTFAIVLVENADEQWQKVMRQIIAGGVIIGVIVLFFCLGMMLNVHLVPEEVWARWTVWGVMIAALTVCWPYFAKIAHRAVLELDESLGAEERQRKLDELLSSPAPEIKTVKLGVPFGSPAEGKNVVSMDIRAKTGASIVAIERYGETFSNIGPENVFRPLDVLVVTGTEAQVDKLRELLGIEDLT